MFEIEHKSGQKLAPEDLNNGRPSKYIYIYTIDNIIGLACFYNLSFELWKSHFSIVLKSMLIHHFLYLIIMNIISYLFGSMVVNLSCKNSHYYMVQEEQF